MLLNMTRSIKIAMVLMIASASWLIAQDLNQPGLDSTGLPGDQFSLQGALAMFQKATDPDARQVIHDELVLQTAQSQDIADVRALKDNLAQIQFFVSSVGQYADGVAAAADGAHAAKDGSTQLVAGAQALLNGANLASVSALLHGADGDGPRQRYCLVATADAPARVLKGKFLRAR